MLSGSLLKDLLYFLTFEIFKVFSKKKKNWRTSAAGMKKAIIYVKLIIRKIDNSKHSL